MKPRFDAYEYIGVIVPGTILIIALAALYPNILPSVESSLSLGDLGLVLIVAFVSGHLLQGLGNVLETLVWSFTGGMPTTWVAGDRSSLLSAEQLKRLDACLNSDLGIGRASLREGRGPMREIVARIRRNGHPDRIEKFNRNYGLMRGIASAFIASAALVGFADPSEWPVALLLLALASVATYRMVRFGIHYAREVFAEYLTLAEPTANERPASQGSST